MATTFYFNRDVKFSELKNNNISLTDNRLRAQDYAEYPFVIDKDDSWVGISKYKPTDNLDDYTFDRVEGRINTQKVIQELETKLNIDIKARY
jgi:hypothetical protein